MPAPNKIYIQIDLESTEAEKAVDLVNKKIKDLGPTTEKSAEQTSKGIKRITTTIDQSASSMDKLASAISSLGLLEMGRQLLKMGDDMNRVRMGMQNMEGGASAFILVQDLAKRAGVSFQFLLKASQDLINAGQAPAVVAGKLQILVDASRRAGKGMEEVMHITEKLRQIAAKSFLSGEDVAVFAQIGVRINDELAKRLKVTRQELQQSMTKIRPDEFLKVAFEMMAAQSKGAAEKMKKELPSAAFEELRTKVMGLAGELEKTLAPVLVKVIDLLGQLIDKALKLLQAFNRLPEWVKTTAVAFGLLAIGIKAVTSAMALWNLVFPAGVAVMARMGGALAFVVGTAKQFYSVAVMTATGMGLMEGAAVTLGVALNAIPWVAIVTALGVIGVGIYNNVKGPDREAEKQQQKLFANYDELRKKTALLEDRMRKARLPLPERLPLPDVAAAGGIVPALTAREDAYIGTMEAALEKRRSLMEKNEQEVKRARDYAANLLAGAMRDQLKIGEETVAALHYAWKQHWENTKIDAKATADALSALMVTSTTEALKQVEVVKNARIKANQDAAVAAREIAILEMQAIADTGPAAGLQLAKLTLDAKEQELWQKGAEASRLNDVMTAKQIEAAKKIAIEDALAKGRTPEEVINTLQTLGMQIDHWQKANLDFRAIQEETYNDQVAKARIESAKTTNAILYQMEKEERDRVTQLAIDGIMAVRDYEVSMATAVEANTTQEKLAQIDTVMQAELAAIKSVNTAQKLNVEATRMQFEAMIGASGLAPELKEERIKIYRDTVSDPQLKALRQSGANQEQQIRIEAWKSGNQVIIEEQKQVYESIASVMGELFDAFVDTNKSVWAAIGDTIKRTLLNAIKAVVTSHLAASLTNLLGYGTVAVKSGPFGSPIAAPVGFGTPPFLAPPSPTGAASGITFNSGDRMMDAITSTMVNEIQSAPSQGGSDRMMSDGDSLDQLRGLPMAGTAAYEAYRGPGGVGGMAGGGGSAPAAGGGSRYAALRESFNIGKSIQVPGAGGFGTKTIPWAQMTGKQRMGAMLSSPGAASMMASVGLPMFMSSLSKRGVKAGLMGVGGAALAGAGLAAMMGLPMIGGLQAGIGIGIFAAGYKRRGWSGLAMTAGGGLLAGATIGAMVGGPVGALVGGAIGLGVGVAVGVVNLFRKSKEDQVRSQIRQTYGVDIADKGILSQIAEVANQRFGGDVRMAVHSQEVQEMVRIYSLMTGQNAALPRPMYSATYAQSAAGGLQMQPVYSGGRLVASPYQGTTTTQFANALASQPPVFVQLNPQQASSIFQGQVVQVLGDNPGAVGAANTTAARSGQGRQAQSGALLEPTTVMA